MEMDTQREIIMKEWYDDKNLERPECLPWKIRNSIWKECKKRTEKVIKEREEKCTKSSNSILDEFFTKNSDENCVNSNKKPKSPSFPIHQ